MSAGPPSLLYERTCPALATCLDGFNADLATFAPLKCTCGSSQMDFDDDNWNALYAPIPLLRKLSVK